MTPRQVRSFGVGCGLWILTGMLHMVNHFMGLPDPASEEEATLFMLFHNFEIGFGGIARTLSEVFEGFSLSFAVLVFLAGFQGLIWLRSPGVPSGTMRRVAGMNAVAALALVLLGLPRLPVVPIACLVAVCLAFLFAAGGPAGAIGLRRPDSEPA